MVTTCLNNLKISYLNTTNGKVRNFKLKLNWDILILLSLFIFNRWETKCSSHHIFFSSWELFDTPDHATLIWNVLHCSNIRFENWTVNIDWNWNNNFNIVRNRFLLELSSHFHHVFNFGFCEVLNNSLDPYERLDMCFYSVSHQIKFTIRRNECDQSLLLEFIQSYTLMELNILEFNELVSRLFACHLK